MTQRWMGLRSARRLLAHHEVRLLRGGTLITHTRSRSRCRTGRCIAGTLTDEALRNGSIKKNPEKRGNEGEPSMDRNGREDNKRTRTGNAFATTTNPVRREKYELCWFPPLIVVPRNVNLINARNLIGYGNQGNQARGRAFMLGAKEARQDPNIMTGTFTLNDHFATTLFDSGGDYRFVFTTFIPLLDIEPSELGFSYEIEIASGQLVEIDKLSDHKAEIICHEKVVRIPLLDGKILRVLGEKPKENVRQLMSTRTKEQKQEEIIVVKDFPEVFPIDLSDMIAAIQEIEFWD
ncbi:hypothetical protein Tco_0997237 [Tanacetum coccineum]